MRKYFIVFEYKERVSELVLKEPFVGKGNAVSKAEKLDINFMVNTKQMVSNDVFKNTGKLVDVTILNVILLEDGSTKEII